MIRRFRRHYDPSQPMPTDPNGEWVHYLDHLTHQREAIAAELERRAERFSLHVDLFYSGNEIASHLLQHAKEIRGEADTTETPGEKETAS